MKAKDDYMAIHIAAKAVHSGLHNSKQVSTFKLRWPKTVPTYLRNAVLTAVLVGFPLSNVLLFFGTNLLLDDQTREGQEAWSRHSFTTLSSVSSRASGLDDGIKSWTNFHTEILSDGLLSQFEHFYDSDILPVQSYGRVLIVSVDFLGPTIASGPATAMATLAELLAGSNFHVTVLCARREPVEGTSTWQIWKQHWRTRGVELVGLPESPVLYDVGPQNALSHRIYEWLVQAEPFDVVHFNDKDGIGYWALKAKHQGLAFQRTVMVLHLLAPHLWGKISGLELLDSVSDLIVDYMQREAVLHADLVVSPSQYMLRWCDAGKWDGIGRGGSVLHAGQLLPAWVRRRSAAVRNDMPFAEVVFLSRLELRKGLVLFCDVLDRIERRSPEVLRGIKVTFLGRVPQDESLPLPGNLRARTDDYVRSRGVKWKSFSWSIKEDMDAQARLDYMGAGSRLAVFSMIAENSPYAILECLVAGIPFIATDVGGVSELIAPQDRRAVLTEPTPKAIAQRLADALTAGLSPAAVSEEHSPEAKDREAKAWVLWHHIAMHRAQNAPSDTSLQLRNPLVTVCIVHFNNPKLLQQAITSLEGGTYQNIEVVIVDDGSTDREAQRFLEDLNLKFQVVLVNIESINHS